MADYGDCGKPVCCNTHLTRMPPVSMRMAKLQKSTLDPAKISGRCGRLKCCLRYEFDTYQEMSAELPDPGARVQTARGQGRVEAVEILSQRVLVELDDHRRVLLEKSEIQAQLTAPRKRQSDPADDRDLGDETHR
jgi:cell fate regulator YaaT (PSP1 superfamily)